jgi:anti-sigma factor RsiW
MRDLHLTAEQVASCVDGLVEPGQRLRIEAHLATCDRCLDEIVAVLRQTRPEEDVER